MRNQIRKYILLLSVITLACFGQFYSRLVSVEKTQHHPTSSSVHLEENDRQFNSVSLFVFEKAKAKFTTNDNDEEEIGGSAKKFLQGHLPCNSSFYTNLSGYFADSQIKCLHNFKHLTHLPLQRLYLKFRVLRL